VVPLLLVAAGVSLTITPTWHLAALWSWLAIGGLLAARSSKATLVCLGAALLVDQAAWGYKLLPRGEPALFYPTTPTVTALRAELGDDQPRLVGHAYLAYPAILGVYGFSDPRAHNPLVPNDYIRALEAAFSFAPSTQQYFSPFHDPKHPFLDFLGVRGVLSNVHQPHIEGMEPVRLPDEASILYRNRGALPRWFLATEATTVRREAIAKWIAELDLSSAVAILEHEVVDVPLPALRRSGAAVRVLSHQPGEVRLEIEPGGPGLLATSLVGPRGWRATSSRGELRTLTINGAFLGVELPDEARRIALRYRPPGLTAGVLLAVLSAVILLAGTVPRLLAWNRR
jgi:hypothetical protein